MDHAPITLFTYNRLWHTQQTVEALQKNELADASELFVFSDGPKSEADKQKVQSVRDYLKTITGFKKVSIFEKNNNLGLAQSIITGVTEIVNKYGRIIVLEDDMVTSPYFLRFMNDALEFYQDEEQVISVHGYIYPIKAQLPETFLIKDTGCWGWGTWKRGWDLFEPDGGKLLKLLESKKLTDKFDMNGSYPFTQMLRDQIMGKNNSWAILWQASAFVQDKLTLFPGRSLVKNIGFDDTGTHCSETSSFDVEPARTPLTINAIPIQENRFALKKLEEYFRSIGFAQSNILSRIKKRGNTLIGSIHLLPLALRFYNILFNPEYRQEWLLKSRIKKIPRFTVCQAKLHGWDLSIPDSASFLSAYKDIFVEQIYSFKAKDDMPRILDLGANIGLSVLYFKKLYPKAHITAFEADPKIFGYLKKNVHGNGYSDVQLINKAAWYKNTTLEFSSEGADGGRAAFSGDDNLIDIDAIDMNEFLKDRQFDFLKMDIEGAEEFVLPACKDHLQSFAHVFVEYHSKVGRKQCLGNLISILSEAGFRIHLHSVFCSPTPFVGININTGFDLQLNIFAWREH